MITASVVLYKTPREQIDTIIRSFQPSEDRRLVFVDNSGENGDFFTGQQAGHMTSECENASDYIEYFSTGRNLGYGSAHNIAIKRAIELDSEFHVVLNPDLSFEPSVIDELADYARAHEDVVYMLPEVVNEAGEVQHLCKLLPTPSDLIFRRFLSFLPSAAAKNDSYVLLNSGYDHIMNVPCLSGCFMFMRTAALAKYNLLFDERFFMYCEDFDLMRRLHRIGKTIYYPLVRITHHHERGSYHSLKMLCHHTASAIRYFNKYGWWHDPERNRVNAETEREIADSAGI
ncbi:MAG: hypothetical protein ACI4CS_10325 [Candidatus Weimeria sp.]